MARIFNFSSGPAMLPFDVIKKAQQELCNWHNLGASILEISHRSEEFIQVIKEAEKDLRELLSIPLNYKILFCHGGGRGQFSALPLNLLGNKHKADYIDTGYWSANAIEEAKKYCTPNIINAKTIINGKHGIIPMKEWQRSYEAAYVHYCSNETADGILIDEIPNFEDNTTIVADFSSNILSTPLDISRFGMIYAGAQKNIGPSGMALVIIREDLLGKASKFCPSILNYKVLVDNNLIFNTPPTFTCYLAGMVFKWLKEKGGVQAIDVINRQKADLLYKVIDNSNLYYNNITKACRSRMNVIFHLREKKLNKFFIKESYLAGLYALQGHRAIGGMRASIYNSMPLEGVKALTDFMIDFEYRYH